MTTSVGIKYILDDREFRQKIRSSNADAERLTKTNKKHLSTIKAIGTQEKRGLSTKKKELNLINKTNRALEKQNRVMKSSVQSRRVAGGRMVSGTGMMGAMGSILPMMGVAAAGYGAMNVVKGGSERQAGWTQVSNMLGADVSGKTKQDMRDIAYETAQENQDVITSYYDALSAGFSEQGSKAVSKYAGIFATGGNFDIATAQSALLTTLETFKDLKPEDVIDLLAGTVKAGRVNERQVATNVGQFMASGQSLGIGAQEQLAAFAGISKSLGNADEAGTALGALFTALQKATPAAIDLGIDANLVEREGLQGVLNKLSKELEGKDAAGKAEIISGVFGNVRAKKGLFAFLNDPESLSKLGEVVGSGDAMANFRRASDDLNRETIRLKVAMTNMTTAFLDNTNLIGGLAGVSGGIAEWISKGTIDGEKFSKAELIGEIVKEGAIIQGKNLIKILTPDAVEADIAKTFKTMNDAAIKDSDIARAKESSDVVSAINELKNAFAINLNMTNQPDGGDTGMSISSDSGATTYFNLTKSPYGS